MTSYHFVKTVHNEYFKISTLSNFGKINFSSVQIRYSTTITNPLYRLIVRSLNQNNFWIFFVKARNFKNKAHTSFMALFVNNINLNIG